MSKKITNSFPKQHVVFRTRSSFCLKTASNVFGYLDEVCCMTHLKSSDSNAMF